MSTNITLPLAAAQQALEALRLNNDEWKALADSGDCGHWTAESQDHYKQTNAAIVALEAALAQEPEPVQEPVGWMNPDDGRVIPAQTMRHAREGGGASLSSVRSYTVPLGPIRAQRPPLTDEEIDKATAQERDALLDHIYEYGSTAEGVLERIRKLCRAIERKVRGE